jgi:putative endonuclease
VDRQSLGLEAETRAVQLFEQAGFTVLSRNFRCRAGELDIIAQRGEMLVIAEVRLRSDVKYGGGAASITPAKRKRIIRAARYLLRRRPALAALAVRFDVLALGAPGAAIEWIEGAFDTSRTT